MFLFILVLALTTSRGSKIVLRHVSKTFQSKGGWLKEAKTVMGVRDVSLELPCDGICALVGPSGAGKSTLCELVSRKDTPTSGKISTPSRSLLKGEIISPLYYMTYDRFKSVDTVLGAQATAARIDPTSHPLLLRAREILIQNGNAVVDSLLESERRCFDIMLALQRIVAAKDPGCAVPESQDLFPVVVLDEYLDKDLSAVRARVRMHLSKLIADPKVRLRVIVPTHSRSVMQEADYVVVLKDGSVFSKADATQGNLKTMRLPLDTVLLP